MQTLLPPLSILSRCSEQLLHPPSPTSLTFFARPRSSRYDALSRQRALCELISAFVCDLLDIPARLHFYFCPLVSCTSRPYSSLYTSVLPQCCHKTVIGVRFFTRPPLAQVRLLSRSGPEFQTKRTGLSYTRRPRGRRSKSYGAITHQVDSFFAIASVLDSGPYSLLPDISLFLPCTRFYV